eukprot:scaffold288768_cov222-Cyclotella_meneghiniana.AAC.1
MVTTWTNHLPLPPLPSPTLLTHLLLFGNSETHNSTINPSSVKMNMEYVKLSRGFKCRTTSSYMLYEHNNPAVLSTTNSSSLAT